MSDGHYSPRCRGLFKVALKGLGFVEPSDTYETESKDRSVLYHCLRNECGRIIQKGRLIGHYRMFHKEIYDLISGLMSVWGLVGDNPETE